MARSLQRWRVTNGFNASFGECLAEATFLERYNRKPSVDEIRTYGNRQSLAPVTDDGIVVGLITGKSAEVWDVSVDRLDVDVIVFGCAAPTGIEYIGWLRTASVEECKVAWSEDDYGNRDSYSHIVHVDNLFAMPTELVFDEPCAIDCDQNAIWNYELEGWGCFYCDRIRPCSADAKSIAEVDLRTLAETIERNQRGERQSIES